jgi:hypothetical protein
MRRTLYRVLAMTALLGASLLTTASPASAMPPVSCDNPGGSVCYNNTDYISGTLSWPYECFGWVGDFKGNSRVMLVDWNKDNRWDECFGIAPNRAIYHAWPNSVGWDPMPNGGAADDVASAFLYLGVYRTVKVRVATYAYIGYYCSSLINNSWGSWGRCNPAE